MNEEAQAYKERSMLEAQGEVARFEELLPQFEAAPEVTRQRIYLETMEAVYSNTTKVMIDTEGSGNMMYLPLDKIMERQNLRPSDTRNFNNTLQGLQNQGGDTLTSPQIQTSRNTSSRSGRN